MELYGITDRNHGWLKSYLSIRRKFVQINEKEKTSLETISFSVPQGSILGTLLFLLYVNDLKNASNILDPIMLADDTNLFFTHNYIRYLFQVVNQELENINQWFISNKLSLNIYIYIYIKRTKYSFFHNPSQKENIPLLLPKLIINKNEIQWTESIKSLGVLLDENLSWKKHIKYNENKTAENLGFLDKAKHYLNKRSLLVLYYSFIHTYINYRNITWGSTNIVKTDSHVPKSYFHKAKIWMYFNLIF